MRDVRCLPRTSLGAHHRLQRRREHSFPGFPSSSKNIPCSRSQGIRLQPRGNARESRSDFAQLGAKSAKFPVLSLLNRDQPAETSSSPTPPTAIESARAETFRSKREAIRKNPLFRGVLGDRLSVGEPETEDSGLSSHRRARLSLLPGSAVPLRARSRALTPRPNPVSNARLEQRNTSLLIQDQRTA